MTSPALIAICSAALASYAACAYAAVRMLRSRATRRAASQPSIREATDHQDLEGTRVLAIGASPWWVEIHDGGAPRAIPLGAGRMVIGSHARADLRVADPFVSGQHASLRFVEGELQLTDLDSTNGTYVDGKRVERCVVHHKDTIRIGRTRLQFVCSDDPATQAVAN